MIQQQPVKNTCTYTYYLTKQKIDFWHESSNYYIFDFMFYFNVLFVLHLQYYSPTLSTELRILLSDLY